MASIEQLQRLIEELGPATAEVEAVQQSSESSWEVAFADDNIVQIEFVENRQLLVFTADLGPLPVETQSQDLRVLMVFNCAWLSNGGLRLGLDAPDGSVQLMYDVHAAELHLQALQDHVCAFADQASAWREVIPVGFGGQSASDQMSADSALLPAGIRV